MLTAIAGERWSASLGQVIELDAATAHRLIAKGQAVAVDSETATIKPPEAAVTRRKK